MMGGLWNKVANREIDRQPEIQAERGTDENEIIGLPADMGGPKTIAGLLPVSWLFHRYPRNIYVTNTCLDKVLVL